ncbi:MAG: DUF6691 family protein [Verrucomicrobiota bacterium]
MKASQLLAVLASGTLFGFGLAVSSMVSPETVLCFLCFSDWGLTLVMGGAIAVVLPVYRWAPRLLRRPLLGTAFGAHGGRLHRDTLVGALFFGVGWGLSGVCPGPAIASLGTGNWPTLYALAGIILGAYLHGRLASVPDDLSLPVPRPRD